MYDQRKLVKDEVSIRNIQQQVEIKQEKDIADKESEFSSP